MNRFRSWKPWWYRATSAYTSTRLHVERTTDSRTDPRPSRRRYAFGSASSGIARRSSSSTCACRGADQADRHAVLPDQGGHLVDVANLDPTDDLAHETGVGVDQGHHAEPPLGEPAIVGQGPAEVPHPGDRPRPAPPRRWWFPLPRPSRPGPGGRGGGGPRWPRGSAWLSPRRLREHEKGDCIASSQSLKLTGGPPGGRPGRPGPRTPPRRRPAPPGPEARTPARGRPGRRSAPPRSGTGSPPGSTGSPSWPHRRGRTWSGRTW